MKILCWHFSNLRKWKRLSKGIGKMPLHRLVMWTDCVPVSLSTVQCPDATATPCQMLWRWQDLTIISSHTPSVQLAQCTRAHVLLCPAVPCWAHSSLLCLEGHTQRRLCHGSKVRNKCSLNSSNTRTFLSVASSFFFLRFWGRRHTCN